jgi:hypothetical protein
MKKDLYISSKTNSNGAYHLVASKALSYRLPLFNFTTNISDFNVEDLPWHFYNKARILTFGAYRNYLVLTLLFVLSTNVACMCRFMCCSGQD